MTEELKNKASIELTKNQLEFLEECTLEFSERFTDADLEYKKIYDLGIPLPPIVYPWWGHLKGRNFNRGGPGSSRYNDNYRERTNDREGNQRRPGSHSWYGAGDSTNKDEGHRRYNDGHRSRNRDHHQHYRPY